MKYEMDRAGQYGRSRAGDYILRKSPGTQFALRRAAEQGLAAARARAPYSGDRRGVPLRDSGSVEFLGIKRFFGGEPRMVLAITFRSRHAAISQKRTGFLTAGLGKYTRR